MTIIKDSTGSVQPNPVEALARILPELKKIPRSELLVLNLDPLAATATVQAALPNILELRPIIAKTLNDFDLSHLDQLETYCLALIQCHAHYLSIRTPPEDLRTVIEETSQARALLSSNVKLLTQRGIIKGTPTHGLRRNKGHKNIASDVLIFVSILRAHWNCVSSKCALSLSELERAQTLALRLIQLLGYRERTPRQITESTLLRQSAFTLFIRAYNEVRRAVSYVRWNHGDIDRVAPSLYRGKRSARKRANRSGATTPTAETPTQDPFLN